MRRMLLASLKMALVTMVVTGVLYPLAVTGIAQIAFPSQANGSLARAGGRVVGSDLVGQAFASPRYFHGRPSGAGDGYDATESGSSNLAPGSAALADRVRAACAIAVREEDGLGRTGVPVDLVTESGSGLDPHITPAAARAQVARVARARDMTPSAVRRIVEANVEGRFLGVIGEARVNVLRLNRALDAASRQRRPRVRSRG